MYNAKIRCVASGSIWFKESEVYIVENGYIIIDGGFSEAKYEDIKDINSRLLSQFEEVDEKVKLLLKDDEAVKTDKYTIWVSRRSVQWVIRIYNASGSNILTILYDSSTVTTLDDINLTMSPFGIEIIEPPTKHKIKFDGEYTDEELSKLSELGIKFTKIKE